MPERSSTIGSTTRKLLVGSVRLPWRPFRWLIGIWRRSVQFRVVTGTLVLSSAVIVVVGWVLLQQVTAGLVDEKVENSLEVADAGARAAKDEIAAADPAGDPGALLKALGNKLLRARAYYYLVSYEPGRTTTEIPKAEKSPTLDDIRSIPVSFQRAAANTEDLAYSPTTIKTDGDADRPGLMVGTKIRQPYSGSGASFVVIFVFDFAEQEATLTLLSRSLLAVGVLIVVLLGFVTWFVTRQVVTPVRLARRIAERLAAGFLDERMHVSGEDDLARLATSFNQMAASLQRQIRQLEELSRVQRRFVSDVSHELRTPLTTVRMAADVLYEARSSFDVGLGRSAELLQAELDRFEALLADLLEISRFDAGAAALELEDADLRDIVRAVADRAAPLAVRKGSRLVLDLPDDPCISEVDARRIDRVLRNLVGNAIDYGEGEDITIQVAADAKSTAVSVRDRGIGLKPGESAMVFERFWRADPARARTTGGTGLGLAIAMEDVSLHGGWLQAWGEPGSGAHFRMTLPRRVTDVLDHSPLPLVPADRRAATSSALGPGVSIGGRS